MNKFSILRKVAIVLCVILIVTCSFAIGILSQDVRLSYNTETGDYDYSTARLVKNLYYVLLILSALLFSLSFVPVLLVKASVLSVVPTDPIAPAP